MRPIALLCSAALAAGCAGVTPEPRPAPFPQAAAWKTLLSDFVTPPLAAAGRRVYVATRDGVVRALDATTGETLWKATDLPGTLTAADGTVLVRSAEGRLTSLHPRDGKVRWSVETSVPGALPAVIDEQRALVAGRGLAAVDVASGRLLWTEKSGAEITAAPVPVPAAARLLTGEADGALRCRDRESGVPIWTLPTSASLLAPPLVDRERGVFYLGTTDKRILEARLEKGKRGWRWKVGADVAHPGVLTRDAVLFASLDAVLSSLRRNGNLAWRAPLPSRPVSGPIVVGPYFVVACLEDLLVAVAPETGTIAARLRTNVEIRTPPVLVGDLLVLGLRDRSVAAYPVLRPPTPPAPAPEPAPGGPPSSIPPAAPAAGGPQPSGALD